LLRGKDLKWNEHAQEAFEDIKAKLCYGRCHRP